MIRNVEVKASITNIAIIREFLLKNATQNLGTDWQVDTYFKCSTGKLKIREGNIENSLIYYNRTEVLGLKKSNRIEIIVDEKREIFY